MNPAFKTCPGCGAVWHDRKDFLKDPEIAICGYQPDFEDLERGLLLFNHLRAGRGTTFSVSVAAFSDLVMRPILSLRVAGSPDCPTHCFRMNDLEPCPMRCECAFVRDVIQVLRRSIDSRGKAHPPIAGNTRRREV